MAAGTRFLKFDMDAFTSPPEGCAIQVYKLTTEEGPGYNICEDIASADPEVCVQAMLSEVVKEFRYTHDNYVVDVKYEYQVNPITHHIDIHIAILYKLAVSRNTGKIDRF